MDQHQRDSHPEPVTATYGEFLRLTRAMLEALGRSDLEGFCRHVNQRDEVMLAIGDHPPVDASEAEQLAAAAELNADVEAAANALLSGLTQDIRGVRDGQLVMAAYGRTARGLLGGASKFIDQTK